jgi:hypothetical protein
MSVPVALEPRPIPTTTPVFLFACAMCEERFEGCDGVVCHGLDAD